VTASLDDSLASGNPELDSGGPNQGPRTIHPLMTTQITPITLSMIHSSTLACCFPTSPWNQATMVAAATPHAAKGRLKEK